MVYLNVGICGEMCGIVGGLSIFDKLISIFDKRITIFDICGGRCVVKTVFCLNLQNFSKIYKCKIHNIKFTNVN